MLKDYKDKSEKIEEEFQIENEEDINQMIDNNNRLI